MPDHSRLVIFARLEDVRHACDFVVEAAAKPVWMNAPSITARWPSTKR